MLLQRLADMPVQVREAIWTARACPLCFGARPAVALGTRSYDVATRHARFRFVLDDCVCGGCGFAMAGAVPDEQFLSDYYADAFLRVKPDGSVPIGFDAAFRLRVLKAHAPSGAFILEIGAGDGAFVETAGETGFIARGIDPVDGGNVGAVAHEAFHAAPDGGGSVDAVVTYYVLEHIADPRHFLTSCKSWLRTGGVLIIEVPNLETHPDAALQNEHLSYFTPDTLRALVEACGFRVVAQEARGSRYFGQTLVARLEEPARNVRVPLLPEETAADAVRGARSLIAQAAEKIRAREEAARRLIADILADNQGRAFDLIAWGANQIATEIGFAARAAGIEGCFVVDQSSSKLGHFHDGFETAIRAPQFAADQNRHRVFVICSEAWHDDIRHKIESMMLSGISVYSLFGRTLP
jgi:SAM-dependent methyltransferase